MMNKPRRYAGASPFRENQSHIFFGREAASLALHRMIKQESIVVLHSKSGMGKSSLIRAGLLPLVRKDYSMEPVEFRLYASASGKDNPIVTTKESLKKKLDARSSEKTPIEKLLPNDNSLWRVLKEIQIQRLMADQTRAEKDPPLLLIFDQFEELFTYTRKELFRFRSELAEVMNSNLPQRYWDVLSLYEGMKSPISSEEKRLLMRPMKIHALFSIREDRLHKIGELSDYLPGISKNWFKLDHLNTEEATRAIEAPAQQQGNFATSSFSYSKALKNSIVNYLSNEYEGIESAQLQVICDAIDRKMDGREDRVATPDYIGELENITANYYWEKIHEIEDETQRAAARELIEEQLIFEESERRLSLFSGQIIESGVDKATLDLLVDSYLLRAEPDLRGGYNYEISHDSLVTPILEAKRERIVAEKWAEQERKDAENAKRLQEEVAANKQAKRLNIILTVLLFLSLLTGAYSIYSFFDAKANEEKAEELLSKFKKAQEDLFKANAESQESKHQKIRLYLSNAEVFLESQDPELAQEEISKAQEIIDVLQTEDYELSIKVLQARINELLE